MLPIVPHHAPSAPATTPAPRHLPTVAALDALWAEFSTRRVALPQRLWRRFVLTRTLDIRPLQADKVPVRAPAGKINHCAGCTELCCVGPRNTVLLRLRDLATLIDVGRTELISPTKPSFDAATLRARPALRRHVASSAWRRFPVLRQNAYGACMALNAAGRCTLYPHWPQSCARFPYALDTEPAEVFYSQRCRSFVVHPQHAPEAHSMAAAAVAGYNERIRDALLLRFRAESLAGLGLARYLFG